MKRLLLCLVLASILTMVTWPVRLGEVPFGTVVLDRNGKVLKVFLSEDDYWRLPLDSGPLPEKVVSALVASEDQRFFSHHGIDPIAVVRAIVQNFQTGAIVSGASTLTMQVIRIDNPRPRTILSKIVEAFSAYRLELRSSKEDILRHYLNRAPFGGNLEGIRAAAFRFFGKDADDLTWAETCALVVLPRSPSTVNMTEGRDLLLQRRDTLLKKLLSRGILNDSTYHAALRERLPSHPYAMPSLAPHLAIRLRGTHPGETIQTTIDPDLQRMAESEALRWSQQLSDLGIHNLSLLVAETQTGRVRAYVGSNSFYDHTHQGQVDGVQAPRSSGSILKPFLYALSIQKGDLLPDSLLPDVPMRFGRFEPANAGHTYSGSVTVREALTRSLNVPAVFSLRQYGVLPFHDFLAEAGMTTLWRPPSAYGLTLVVGGGETSLWDLVALYRGLGRGGLFSGITVVEGDPVPAEHRMISPGASYLVLDILRDVRRPGWEYAPVLMNDAHPLAWKTGTSFHQRDAWALAVSPDWTIGVWAGNFTGEGNANLIGSRTAGPLLFQIYHRLPGKSGWFPEPSHDLTTIEVCADTGFRPSPFCPSTRRVLAPRSSPSVRPCPYHRDFVVDSHTGKEVCSMCWQSESVRHESRLIFPPKISAYLRMAGVNTDKPPVHERTCPTLSGEETLQFIYPLAGSRIWIPRDYDGVTQQVVLRAAHLDTNSPMYWFIDERFAGVTKGDHSLAASLEDGVHEAQIVDPDGHAAAITFEVYRKSRS
ncbi:MAG TPA: penicillin-binding protein 1C [Thermoanaerobaculia bacterium]|nr:penicillin-binding protein 1C [Thermoanaerobaculia bacterium]HUM28554.1 penicillin-binding protein 1C [Thermoanaerobaculia bacterium]HXK66838.1 penicillin-binding protein 1C [Thermoanaerobaculia bacterium]